MPKTTNGLASKPAVRSAPPKTAPKAKAKATPKGKPTAKAKAAAKRAIAPPPKVLPPHVTEGDRRLLTLDDIRRAPMCEANKRDGLLRAERAFRVTPGGYIDETTWVRAMVRQVPRSWKKSRARDMATVHQGDLRWAARNLLPEGWYDIYRSAVDEGIRNGRIQMRKDGGQRGHYAARMKVRFAVFAALYVEAGRP